MEVVFVVAGILIVLGVVYFILQKKKIHKYSRQQIIFALNFIANSPSNHHGTVSELEAYAKEVVTKTFANSEVQELIGEWELVWGPLVYQESGSTVADNAMYVAQSKMTPTDFVVAISGTNPISRYGWIHEDFLINPMQSWPYAKLDPQPQISNGTKIGLNVLLNIMKNSSGQSLTDYLKQQVSASQNPLSITVTGHSLGGALAPATALALKNLQGEASGWDPKSSAGIAVEPTAGPTPGNEDWATYYDSQLGSSTNRIWNAIDIVPRAWELDTLAAIPTLYQPTIPESELISAATGLAKDNSIIAGNMYQIRHDVCGLPGEVDPWILLNIGNILSMLEVLLANDLIDKLAKRINLSSEELVLLKKFVDHLIDYLTEKSKSVELIEKEELKSLKLDFMTELEDSAELLFKQFIDFLEFLVQVAYQHTSAYNKLIGIEAFADLVNAIKVKIKNQA